MRPTVSVVIPVFNDGRRLALCLEAVARQTYPRSAMQVIVVDNRSDEDIRAVTERFPGVTCVREDVPGPAAARNKGVALARGEILAFTDADCLPAADWIESGVRRLASEPGCGVLGGRIDMTFADPERPSPAELYDSLTYLQQRRHVERDHFAATANLFSYKAVFDAAGGFDVRFPTASGEDYEWGNRVRGKGYRVVYADEARISHPAMRTLAEISRKTRRIRDGSRLLKALGPRRSALADLIREIVTPLWICARILRDGRLKSLYDKACVCGVAVRVHYASYYERS